MTFSTFVGKTEHILIIIIKIRIYDTIRSLRRASQTNGAASQIKWQIIKNLCFALLGFSDNYQNFLCVR